MGKPDVQKIHKYFASDCFNRCWGLIDKAERTEEENEEMCRLSEVSLWHWLQVEGHTQENLSISYWQLGRAYAVAGKGEEALDYAGRCVKISEEAGLEPFYVGYAFEALARAHMLNGDKAAAEKAKKKATDLAESVEDKESRNLILADLETVS